jgi:hypothetical protein
MYIVASLRAPAASVCGLFVQQACTLKAVLKEGHELLLFLISNSK